MICERTVKRFCKDDLSLIENYDKAINDNTQTWHVHHRLETDRQLSRQYLIDADLYYNRPANELILLTPFEHRSLHHKDKIVSKESKTNMSKNHADVSGENNPMYGKSRSEETRKKLREAWKKRKGKPLSEETIKKRSDAMKDRKWVHNDKERKMVKSDELEDYLNNGYKIGKKII